MRVRRAAPEDLPGLAVLLEQLGYPAGPEEIERRLERLDGELFVAADDEDAHAAYRALGFEDTGRHYAKRL